ncbi:MAG: class I SAM-dependent methyltransferase [Caulobacteraceae bacterium]|nr:class I SAM-dependent methyltransferase [Caulobacteraceae bacterium]
MKENFKSYKYIVDGIIKQIDAEYILEIGLGPGWTAEPCLKFLTSKQKGKYTAIDMAPPQEGLNILNQYDKKFWELRIGDTTKDDNLFQNFHENRNDIILVDGSHWYSHVAMDIQKLVIYGCAKPETIFVFHDSEGSHTRYGISEACQKVGIKLFEIIQGNIIIGKFKDL